MELPSPLDLPLSVSDLQSPEKTKEPTHHHKLEPINREAFRRRKKQRTKKSKALNDSTEVGSSVDQLSKATDDDIQSYLNERLSRLDSLPDPPTQAPTTPKLDPENRTSSQNSQSNDLMRDKTTPPLSGIGLLEPNIRPHSSSDNQPPLSDTKVSSQSLSETQIQRRRRRTRRSKKRQQPLSQSEEDGSTLEPDGPHTSLITTGSRRELPELSMDDVPTPAPTPGPDSPITVTTDGAGHNDNNNPPILHYNLSCPTDPIYLVDEEDVHDISATTKDPTRLNGVKGPGILNTVQPNGESFNNDQPPLIKATYRQIPETGAFVVNRNGQTQGEEYDGAGTEAEGRATSITNTSFTKIIHHLIKRLSLGAHGILAGLSIWNSVVAMILLNATHSGDSGHIVFLKYCSDLPLVLHSLYLFLLFFVIVTTFDRIDISKAGVNCIQRCTRNLSEIALTIAMILLLVAFTLTVSVGFIDERIARFHSNPILWSDILYSTNVTTSPTSITPLLTVDDQNYYPKNEGGQVNSGWLTAWLIVDVIKTLAIFGSWLMTFLCTLSTDNMEEYLDGLECQGNEIATH